jgi:signal transduction histidine kinase
MTFSPEGGSITISLTRHARSVRIRIRDEGEGIDTKHLARLMRPFEQGEAPLTRRSEGAGLGLPIARLLCKAMKGALRLDSAPGAGFIATVRLPLAGDTGSPQSDHAA